jgi:hypothetical protein
MSRGNFGSIDMTGPINMNSNLIKNLKLPTLATDAVNRQYVDDAIARGGSTVPQLTAGTGIVLTNNSINVANSLPNVKTIGTLYDLVVSTSLTAPAPTQATHAATKDYTDNSIATAISNIRKTVITAGTGITNTNDTISVNPAQPQITTVGPLSTFCVAVQYLTPTANAVVAIGNFPQTFLDPAGTLAKLTLTFPLQPSDGQNVRVRTTKLIEVLETENTPTGPDQEFPPSLDVDEVLHYIYVSAASKWFRF